ncbi:DUF4190 domain-containing protein [Gordonia aurantiaca]|uniref:DUF4190 domain-containing protein n=1 Tax=Gordonia sp. B21 TaxID=3151852 RepID=UPI00326326E9
MRVGGPPRPGPPGGRPGVPPAKSRPDALGDEPTRLDQRPGTPENDAGATDTPQRPDAASTVLVEKPVQPPHDDTPGSSEDRTVFAPVSQAYSAIDPTTEDEPEDNVASQRRGVPRLNRTAVWALVLSALGITFFIGLFLGYRARTEIRRNRESGRPFADVAIWLGWFYLIVLVFGLLVYGWILFIA